MILTISFVSGSFFGGDEPEEKDIEKSLILKIPTYLDVNDIDIQISENTGTKVEPVYTSRFKGTLETKETLYRVVGKILNKYIIEEKIKSGTEIKIHGVARSLLNGDKWQVNFKSLKIPKISGKLISDFEVGGFVISGSKEEEDLKKQKIKQDKKAAEEQKIREAKAAEEQKIREAKAAEEQKIREAKAAEEQKAISQRISLIIGVWKGTYSCGRKNNNLTLKIEDAIDKIKATFYFSTPRGEEGSFTLLGSLSENNDFNLKPTGWIKKPSGYHMLGLKGKINNTKDGIYGKVTGGCKNFELHK